MLDEEGIYKLGNKVDRLWGMIEMVGYHGMGEIREIRGLIIDWIYIKIMAGYLNAVLGV